MSTENIAEGLNHAPRSRVVFDVETVSGWRSLPPEVRAATLRKHREAELRRPAECRGLLENYPPAKAATDPWLGQVVVVALFDPEKRAGVCLYRTPETGLEFTPAPEATQEGAWRFEPRADERALLRTFWDLVARHPGARLEGFNSRNFDAHYLFVRSYVLGVPCTLNVLPYRYSSREVLDLFDLLGGWERGKTPSLDVVCRAAGIESPKSGMTGKDVQRHWDEGRVLEVARYCARDVAATSEAVDRWDATVGRVFGAPRNKG